MINTGPVESPSFVLQIKAIEKQVSTGGDETLMTPLSI